MFEAAINGTGFALEFSDRTEGYRLRHRGYTAVALVCSARSAELHTLLPEKQKADTSKLVLSPMPGLVVSIAGETGQAVKGGEILLVVEAMKMENVLKCESKGVVKKIHAEQGANLSVDAIIIEFEKED